VNVVLLETSANQAYIFGPNRLREAVGASELIARVGTQWVVDALAAALRTDPHTVASCRIAAGDRAELVVATSGKAIVLAEELSLGHQLVEAVTTRALRDAPGLDVAGATWPVTGDDPFRWPAAMSDVHGALGQARSHCIPAEHRFLALPPFARCSTSDLPANEVDRSHPASRDAGAPVPMSLTVAARRRRGVPEAGVERVQRALTAAGGSARLRRRLADVEEDVEPFGDWLAFVHVDGNGIGQLMFGQGGEGTDYVEQVRSFSLALDEAAAVALARALDCVWPQGGEVPVAVLVLGGDDLTLACPGSVAVDLAAEYLSAFTDHTATDTRLTALAGGRGLGACAGIAIVKPHFPFSLAYAIADELTANAKSARTEFPDAPFAALDFHVNFASGAQSVRDARVMPPHRARPLLVRGQGADDPEWAEAREWQRLSRRADTIAATAVSRTQLAALRNAMTRGRHAAERRAEILTKRIAEAEPWLAELYEDGDAVWLLDALELAELRKLWRRR